MAKGEFQRAIGRLTEWLTPLVGLRDVALVVGAGLYLVGYVVWSLYAGLEGLGLLPVLSAQYVAAGATIGVFLGLAWIVIGGLWMARSRLHTWLETPTEVRLTIRWILVFVLYLTAIAMLIYGLLDRTAYKFTDVSIFPSMLLTSFLLIFFSTEANETPRWLRSANTIAKYATPFIISFSLVVSFMGRWYGIALSIIITLLFLVFGVLAFTQLPQALGGVSPSCVQLDVDKTMLSREAQEELLPDRDASNLKVARTIPLNLLFAGGDTILVRRREPQPGKDLRVHTIASKLVASTVDCQ